MEYGGCRFDKCREVIFDQKWYGFQVIPLSECRCCLESIANAECYGTSEWSYGIEHGLRSDLQLFLSGTDEDPASSDRLREYLQTQCHHVLSCCPQCKSDGVCNLENPDKMYKIINVKDFQTCNNNMSVAEPGNQAQGVLSKCTSMRTTTLHLIVREGCIVQRGQHVNLRCVWTWQLHLQKDGEKWKHVWNNKNPQLSHTVQIQ